MNIDQKKNKRTDTLSQQSNIMEKKDRLHSILKRNEDNLLNLNSSIIAEIVTIKAEIE